MSNNSVVIKSNKYGIVVRLDETTPYDELLVEIANKFKESEKFFKDAKMVLSFEGRKLTEDEERDILDVISENSKIHIVCIIDEDEKREQRFRKTLEEKLNEINSRDGQFYKGTLRSGQILEAETSLVILGDVNPGAKVISKGNVIILGALKGNVYAGATGNPSSFVVALEMNPVQIRIGDVIARSSDETRKNIGNEPKISYVEDGNIYIEPISKSVLNDINL
ncbi:septum site-determining protein MinC [Lachnotalea glycerini]|uniref:Probable septum site-determining protein MinC n=1 Tax=Lachnotalea glycerini TaxID=1763509 RepID=A0A255I3U0_9FIRM|nr:septum site-determining protein MinC [Lachnotalea glycerini]PXV95531.1 septum site-determining protein MinC [Lachnotalea glycerini]RDY32849.1 septum site-determining protein MinC [Lachnotalea glycerini]